MMMAVCFLCVIYLTMMAGLSFFSPYHTPQFLTQATTWVSNVYVFFPIPPSNFQLSSVQLLSRVRLLMTPWTAACQGFLIHHQLLELAQTHVHGVDDASQPSYPLLAPSPPAFNLSIRAFSNESVLRIKWTKYWSFSFSTSPFNESSGLIFFRTDWFDLLVVQGTLKSLLQQFKSINSSALSFLYGPALTSIHDYWKNHSFDYMALCQQSNVSVIFSGDT